MNGRFALPQEPSLVLRPNLRHGKWSLTIQISLERLPNHWLQADSWVAQEAPLHHHPIIILRPDHHLGHQGSEFLGMG